MKRAFTAAGIRIAELANGKVVVKTTTLWNEPLELLYESCDFYRAAVPAVSRQVEPERARLLRSACKDEDPAKTAK